MTSLLAGFAQTTLTIESNKKKDLTVIEQGWAKYCDLLVASRSILLFTKAEGLGK